MKSTDGTITTEQLREWIQGAINVQEERDGKSQLLLHCVLEYLDNEDEAIIEGIDVELEDLEVELGKIIFERMELKQLKEDMINQNG